ncbi:MAG: hypothetical protein ABSG79_03450 [Bryobacteraceae bacterium]
MFIRVHPWLILLVLALCSWAATPVGRVSSSQPFEMNGSMVPVGGVPSWPLFPGDVILTHSGPATVIFRGGSRIILEPNSELGIEVKDKKPVVRLLHGSGKYFLAGVVVALSTKAAISLDVVANAGNFDAQPSPKPVVVSPSR